jgi:hypothetical protein
MHLFPRFLLVLSVVACAAPDDAKTSGDAIPEGLDARMVERRSDGVLVPSKDSLQKLPGYVVDSIHPPAEALRRLQATVTRERPSRLEGGAPTLDALMRAYWTALVRKDTVAIQRLVVSHAEFAYLYFPESAPFAAGMQPVAAWMLYESGAGRGLARALRLADGRQPTVHATICAGASRDEGLSHVYGPCGVVLRQDMRRDTLWLVNSVIRRDGIHKLLGLDNPL